MCDLCPDMCKEYRVPSGISSLTHCEIELRSLSIGGAILPAYPTALVHRPLSIFVTGL